VIFSSIGDYLPSTNLRLMFSYCHPMVLRHAPAAPSAPFQALFILAFSILFAGLMGISPLRAQMTGFHVETTAVHGGMVGSSNLTGMRTYRIFAQLSQPSDFVTAVFGNDDTPLHIATSTTFWHHGAGGNFGTDINPFFLGMFPDLNFDSWVTIGLASSSSAAGSQSIGSIGLTPSLGAFQAGGALSVNSSTGGSWFVLPGATNGTPNASNRVLLGQFTTSGVVTGTLNIQVFIGGNQFNEQIYTGSFTTGLSGCMNPSACNYNPAATGDNGTCVFPITHYNCSGACLADADGDGVCDPLEVVGCQVATACNYNPSATNAGSCQYPSTGYNCAGNCLLDTDGDGVCNPFEVVGCQQVSACNFNPLATDPAACTFPPTGYDCGGNCLLDTDGDGVCNPFEVPGCTDAAAANFNPSATDADGSCAYLGCMDVLACNFNPMASIAGTCLYPAQSYLDCAGDCLSDADADGVCDALEVLGCTQSIALNFNPAATEDDGSCDIHPSAYCGEGTFWDETAQRCISTGTGDGGVGGYGSPCFGDFNGDSTVGAGDLLMWLGVFDTSCE
jgi:hypothetical protein